MHHYYSQLVFILLQIRKSLAKECNNTMWYIDDVEQHLVDSTIDDMYLLELQLKNTTESPTACTVVFRRTYYGDTQLRISCCMGPSATQDMLA